MVFRTSIARDKTCNLRQGDMGMNAVKNEYIFTSPYLALFVSLDTCELAKIKINHIFAQFAGVKAGKPSGEPSICIYIMFYEYMGKPGHPEKMQRV